MTDLNYTYSEGEYAWVTDVLTLYGNINLKANLKTNGILIIKEIQSDDTTPHCLVSDYNTDFEIKVRCERKDIPNGKPFKIQIFTSEEPNYIRYGNI